MKYLYYSMLFFATVMLVFLSCNKEEEPPEEGCTDPLATNYDANAILDDSSCVYPTGCTDLFATNYDPNAIVDDGSCIYEGCTDPLATNYDPDATIDDSSCVYPVKRIFVTSASYNGNLLSYCSTANTGIEAADCLCNNAAGAAGLGGTWKAWISDSLTNAIDRINDVGPWYWVDGTTKVFNNKQNLATTPLVPISVDENGQTVAGYVWTGTNPGGQKAECTGFSGGQQCAGWSSTTSGTNKETAVSGFLETSNSGWTNYSNCSNFCFEQLHLYCIEQ